MHGADGGRRGFLIGYGPAAEQGSVLVSLAGELGRGGSELLDACRARIRGMPVSGVLFDLSALAAADETGARDLFATFRRLRLDGFHVEVRGVRPGVGAVLEALGLSLGESRLRMRARRRRQLPAGRGVPDSPPDIA